MSVLLHSFQVGALSEAAHNIVVSEEYGQFTTVEAGLAGAGAIATTGFRVTVVTMGGDYPENNPLVVPDYVYLYGFGGHESVRIFCLNPNDNGLVLGTDTQARGIQVRDASGVGSAGFYFPAGIHDAELHDCKYNDCDIGFHSEAGLPNPAVFVRDPHCSTGTCSVAYQVSNGGRMMVTGAVQTGAVTCDVFAKADGAGSKLTMYVVQLGGTNTTRAAEVSNTAEMELQVFRVDGAAEGAFVLGTGGQLSLGSSQFTNIAGDHVNLANAATVFGFLNDWYGDNDKIVKGALATLSGIFESSDTSSQPGPTVIGEFWLGTDPAEKVPLSTYIRETAVTGWFSGGAVATNAGRVMDVAAGEGPVNTGTGVVQASWSATQVTAPADSEFWVYVTSASVVSIAMVEPDNDANIVLAGGFADAADIVYLSAHVVPIAHAVAGRHEWTKNAIGSLWQSGLVVTTPGLLALSVSGGTYYRADVLKTAVTAAPATFATWYNDGDWAPTTGAVNVPNGQLNTFGVGLAAIPAGEWVQHALWVAVGGDGTQHHLVYAQASYATQGLAEAAALPTPPGWFRETGMVLAGPVVQQGAAALASIRDHLPIIQTGTAGTVVAAADHGALLGLGDDDHNQYALLAGAAGRNPITGVFDFGGGGLGLPLSAAPVQILDGYVVWDSALKVLTIGDGGSRKTLVDTTTVQTLGNKTLTQPTVADLANMQHDHSTAAKGGAVVHPIQRAVYQHTEASGVDGGAFVTGAWQDRDINTTQASNGADIARAGSTITLADGTYSVSAWGVGYKVDDHRLRLRNTSDGATTVLGGVVRTKDGATALLDGYIVVAGGPKTFQLQAYCSKTEGAGFGHALGDGEAEVYASIRVEKIA